MQRRLLWLAALALVGCPGSEETDAGGLDAGVDAGPDQVVRGPGCIEAGYDPTPFDGSASAPAFDALAPDFTVETLDGNGFTLSEEWGDCRTFTLVPALVGEALDGIEALVNESSPNTTYLFFSRGGLQDVDVQIVADAVDGYLRFLGDDVYEARRHQFRYITTPTSEAPLLREIVSVETNHAFIDSRQRLRDAGSYSILGNGGFVPRLHMARWAGFWFDYERRLADRLAAEDADPDVLVVPWVRTGFDETDEGRLSIELPPANEMARYDRVEIVMRETCEEGARFPVHFGVCPAWDVGHKVTMCEDFDDCLGDDRDQLFRNITGYHSGGWWTEDVSHGLPFFRQGGSLWMRTNRRDFVGTIELRFYDDGDVPPEEHITAAEHLHGLGSAPWDPTHNDGFGEYTFTPPPGTVRVMLDARVQGGGNNQPSGCAEFCSHGHTATVNDTSFSHVFEMESDRMACARHAADGVVAGQFGSWHIDRGSWCPGGPVERWREDITAAVDLSGENRITWTGDYQGDEWPPGGGLGSTVWLVFYGEDGEATVAAPPRETCANPPEVIVRDFSLDHPDFRAIEDAWRALDDGDPAKENARGRLTGVVASDLVDIGGGEWKPVMIWPENTLPYTTAASFDTWWTDTAASNRTGARDGTFLRTRQGTFAYFASNGPLYNRRPLIEPGFGHGAEGNEFTLDGVPTPVNTAMTVEVRGSFVHRPGVRLRLGATSDLWVFVNRSLAFESGGYLGKNFSQTRTVLSMDSLGLTEGDRYDMHIFAVVARGPRANPHLWLEHPACD